MEKRSRFGDLVRESGRPQPFTLWADPKQDRSFSQAVKANRVLTVIQEPGSKHRDFGIIGFHEQPHASYLVFPRALPKNNDSRVIGINYQLVELPAVTNPVRPEDLEPKRRERGPSRPQAQPEQEPQEPAKPPPPEPKKPQPPKPKHIEKAFRVKVRRTATSEINIEVTATNRKAAQQRALEFVKNQPFELNKAAIHEQVVKVE